MQPRNPFTVHRSRTLGYRTDRERRVSPRWNGIGSNPRARLGIARARRAAVAGPVGPAFSRSAPWHTYRRATPRHSTSLHSTRCRLDSLRAPPLHSTPLDSAPYTAPSSPDPHTTIHRARCPPRSSPLFPALSLASPPSSLSLPSRF